MEWALGADEVARRFCKLINLCETKGISAGGSLPAARRSGRIPEALPGRRRFRVSASPVWISLSANGTPAEESVRYNWNPTDVGGARSIESASIRVLSIHSRATDRAYAFIFPCVKRHMRLESGELWFVDTKLKIAVKPRRPVATPRQ